MKIKLTKKQYEDLKNLLVWVELYFQTIGHRKNDEVLDDLNSVFHYRENLNLYETGEK